MPHNVYTGDEEGRVVRSTFLFLSEWLSRKVGHENEVEWRAGRGTVVVWGGCGRRGVESE